MEDKRSYKQEVTPKKDTSSNPYSDWNDRYFKLNRSKRNWQITFLVSSIITLFSLVIILKMSTQISVVPYIIEVDKELGVVRNIGDLRNIHYQPEDQNIIAVLNEHIKSTRAIPLDPVRYGKDIQEQYAFLTEVTQQKLLENIEKDNVQQKMKNRESRDINITSILKIREKTFQVRWIEKNYTENGNIYSENNMTGIFTVDFINPKELNENVLILNPMGIIITDFSISRENF